MQRRTYLRPSEAVRAESITQCGARAPSVGQIFDGEPPEIGASMYTAAQSMKSKQYTLDEFISRECHAGYDHRPYRPGLPNPRDLRGGLQ